jgi:hypothetical protein
MTDVAHFSSSRQSLGALAGPFADWDSAAGKRLQSVPIAGLAEIARNNGARRTGA